MKKVLVFVGLIIALTGCSRNEFSIEGAKVVSKTINIPVVCRDGGCATYRVTIEKNNLKQVIITDSEGYKIANDGKVIDVKCCSLLASKSIITLHEERANNEK